MPTWVLLSCFNIFVSKPAPLSVISTVWLLFSNLEDIVIRVMKIVENQERFLRDLKQFCEKHEKIFIYGAGNIGGQIYNYLREAYIYVEAFIESNIKDNVDRERIFNKKIIEVNKFKPESNSGIIIGVSKTFRQEVVEKLDNIGISRDRIYAEDMDGEINV